MIRWTLWTESLGKKIDHRGRDMKDFVAKKIRWRKRKFEQNKRMEGVNLTQMICLSEWK